MKVININDYRLCTKLRHISKQELLEEMVLFQEKRAQLGQLTPEMISYGIELFTLLANYANTFMLKQVCNNYISYLRTYRIVSISSK